MDWDQILTILRVSSLSSSQKLHFVSIPFCIDHHFETPVLRPNAACRVGRHVWVSRGSIRQVVLRMSSPTCQQRAVWVKSQLSTWDTLALVTSCMSTISSDIGDILLCSDILRGSRRHVTRAIVTSSDGAKCHRWYRSHSTPANYWAYCSSYCILMSCKSSVRRDSLISPCQIQKVTSQHNRYREGIKLLFEARAGWECFKHCLPHLWRCNPFCMHAQIQLICTCFNLVCLFSCRMSCITNG